MFISIIIPLTALNPPAPDTQTFWGREAHALFLSIVRRADPALAESLHEPRGVKPFTVSALLDPRHHRALSAPVRANANYEWRITSFDSHLTQTLVEAILPNLPREVRLGSAIFAAAAPITAAAAHPWAGSATADTLRDHRFGAAAHSDPRIELEFASPTTHRQIHRNILFPQPAALWGGWLRAWNAHAQPAFEDDLIAQVETHVVLSRYELKTQVVDYGEHRAAGWIGRATFTSDSHERALARVLNLLADYAFYCGTGYKTTQGMGMTRHVERPEREKTVA